VRQRQVAAAPAAAHPDHLLAESQTDMRMSVKNQHEVEGSSTVCRDAKALQEKMAKKAAQAAGGDGKDAAKN